MAFIEAVKTARHEDTSIDPTTLHRLRNPIQEPLDVVDPDILLSLRLFLANGTQDAYNESCAAVKEHSPHINLLSHYRVKHKLEEITGVTPIAHHMCPRSCVAYTGPFL
jgi:hypothetical protein